VWREQTEYSFLAAYFEAVRDCAACIADPASAQRLIELFLLEKALYEVRYELDSRPEWVRIPCAGLVQIAASGAPE
jgi:maltose alpha-D-glucosyltransferase/alpha-amylase